MGAVSNYLGFDARYIIYPAIALFIAVILRYGILKYLRKWAARTKSTWDDQIVEYLDSLVLPLLFISILYYLIYLMPFKENIVQTIQRILLNIGLFLTAFFTAKLICSLLKTSAGQREAVQRFLQPLKTLTNVLMALITIALSMKIFDVSFSREGTRLITIIGIIVGAYILIRIINLAVLQMERMVEDTDQETMSEAEKRAKTLGKIINSAGFVLVVSVTVMMILSEFNINIMPIITGAGIAGLAVGFGAQNLVRDVISGFFLILEDQIRVGDVAQINGTSGTVEAIKLRTTILRDLYGTVHIFPNGEIKAVANMTKEYSYSVINLGVAYKENVDEVMKTLAAIGGGLLQDPKFSPYILKPLEVLGVDDFGESQVTIKIRIMTKPLRQWDVGRELRRRIKNTFDAKGIEIPFPQVTVHFQDPTQLSELKLRE
jgi:moderate conductance mechanosensitive channel